MSLQIIKYLPQKFEPSFPPLFCAGSRALPLSSHSVVIMDERKHVNMDHFHSFWFSGPSVILDAILGLSNLFIFEIPLTKL